MQSNETNAALTRALLQRPGEGVLSSAVMWIGLAVVIAIGARYVVR